MKIDSFITRQIISDLAFEVRNFHKNRDGKSWGYSCVVCGDSKTNKRKARFGIAIKDGVAVCNCFNCGYSNTFTGYLKDFHPNLYERYMAETFLSQKPSLYELDHLFDGNVTEKALSNIFYVTKYKDVRLWLQYLEHKKITLKEKNLKKLYNIHKKYYLENT